MKILVIDRDQEVAEKITTLLEPKGHKVSAELVKNEGLERVGVDPFDIIFIDPRPMRDARAMALNIRRAAKTYPYIILMTSEEGMTASEVMQMGCNDFVTKPLSDDDVNDKIVNAQRLRDLFRNLSDTSEDFPSAGGIISKSAFYQLCLSAMDRGGRYNELAFVLAISVSDYHEIKALDGKYVADYAVSKVAHHMVRLRRQSDIIGQTGKNEYSILLQHTQNLGEAMDAVKRFATTFDEIDDFLPAEGNKVTIHITLTHMPNGDCPFEYTLHKKIAVPET